MDAEFREISTVLILQTYVMTLLWGYYHLKRRRTCTRRYWIRPINRSRHERGHFFTLFQEMKQFDPEQFFVYTRMTPHQFSKCLRLARPFLQKKSHRAISPEERLAITLKYLSQGSSMQSLMWEFCLGKATISRIIRQTCTALWDALSPIYLEPPNSDKFSEIANAFSAKWNYPNCIGAIDGKHVSIQCPRFGGSQYYSYTKQHSIILMAVCDANCRFTFVDIGGYGSQGDLTVFRESIFGQWIMNSTLDTPEDKTLPHTNTEIPHHFIADEAFPLRSNIMRPYPGRHLNDAKRIFNYRLSRARRTIENAFGILSSRWRIFRRPIIASVKTVDSVVKAAVVLHNFLKWHETSMPTYLRSYCPPNFEDTEDAEGNVILGQWRQENSAGTGLVNLGRVSSNNAQTDATNIRDCLTNYFLSLYGELPWQYSLANNREDGNAARC